MKKTVLIATALFTALLSAYADAHSRYILPSHTLVSGDDSTQVALDLVISNDFFHPDKAYGGKTTKQLQQPKDDQSAKPQNAMKRMLASTKLTQFSPQGKQSDNTIVNFSAKSVAAATLDETGTYRFSATTDPLLFTVFKKADGSRSRALGEEGLKNIPADATDVKSMLSLNRAETYVSWNGKSPLSLSKTGIELGNEGTHPNDLFANETIRLQFLIDGKPLAKGVEVSLVREGTRHRNNRNVLTVATDEQGFIEFTLDKAGFYFLELNHQVPAKGEIYSAINHGFSAVLEVFPE